MKLPGRGITQECPLGIEKVCLNKQTLTNIYESPMFVFVFLCCFYFRQRISKIKEEIRRFRGAEAHYNYKPWVWGSMS